MQPIGELSTPCDEKLKMKADDYESLPTKNVVSHLMAGALAGTMEHCVMYPLDSVKTRMQLLWVKESLSVTSVFVRMMKKEGYLSPVRGISVAAVSSGPAHSLYFASYEFSKEVLTSRYGMNGHAAHGASGCLATVLHDSIMTPSDAVKQRLQMTGSPYAGAMDCIRKMYKTEGLPAFYRSFSTQLSMNVPFQATHFIIYEIATDWTNPSKEYNPKAHLISGALAGGLASAVTTPLDACKTLLNTQYNGEFKVRGLLNAVKTIHSVHGSFGFFRGLSARVLFTMPSTAISWSTYELLKYILISRRDGYLGV